MERSRVDDEYTRLIRAVDITALYLVKARVERATSVRSPLTVAVRHSVAQSSRTDVGLYVELEFELTASPSPGPGEEGQEPDVQIRTTWRAEYSVNGEIIKPQDIPDSLLQQFAAVNAPVNVWPYFRQQVSTVTGEMGLIPLVLPVLRALPR